MRDFHAGMSFDMATKVLNDNIIEMLETSGVPIGMAYFVMKGITDKLEYQYVTVLENEEKKEQTAVQEKEEEVNE